MHRVKNIETKPDYTLSVTFEDGTTGEINLADRLFGPMFEPLKDPAYFAQASVDAFGVICWPNGADLAPDALYDKLKAA
ncbi:MAG: DUF2442 domain-containing protein [Burkholderiaceae bacterium]|nr:DUF2442 domain-containing protein [Burkholderiaceae bacterium]MCD8517154.1 DUF2442 domain-containing protein [Burkholderiaceae bacterium]MCD8536577.1 DUF2442 domain-containing protein [Burkholderiaceae bacterium]MCD8565300.1 DUF2442 domain-containing protein [Burkholderiaceae bacterium]